MAEARKWYSPRLRRDLVTRLYFRARAEGIPMTALTNRLVEHGLSGLSIGPEFLTAKVAEEPHPPTSLPG